jgi:hypothetical protein
MDRVITYHTTQIAYLEVSKYAAYLMNSEHALKLCDNSPCIQRGQILVRR